VVPQVHLDGVVEEAADETEGYTVVHLLGTAAEAATVSVAVTALAKAMFLRR
jgi:hypothetical protein